MAYADLKAAVLAHCVAAGAGLTPPLEDVKAAFPLPTGRCIRVYYGGETEPPRMTGTTVLNAELVGKVTYIAAFWPVTTLSTELAASIDTDMEALSHSIRGRINGDTNLGGYASTAVLEYGEPDIIIVANARYATLTWRLVTGVVEYAIAS